jgi:hypothetical protein
MSEKIGANMMLVNSAFRNAKSFSLIPVSNDSPYVEALFDPSSSILAVISKVQKESFHMMPRIDENGEPLKLKSPNPQTGKVVKEQRVLINTFNEHYITDKKDIELFINLFAINASSFDYKSFLAVDVEKPQPSKIILP